MEERMPPSWWLRISTCLRMTMTRTRMTLQFKIKAQLRCSEASVRCAGTSNACWSMEWIWRLKCPSTSVARDFALEILNVKSPMFAACSQSTLVVRSEGSYAMWLMARHRSWWGDRWWRDLAWRWTLPIRRFAMERTWIGNLLSLARKESISFAWRKTSVLVKKDSPMRYWCRRTLRTTSTSTTSYRWQSWPRVDRWIKRCWVRQLRRTQLATSWRISTVWVKRCRRMFHDLVKHDLCILKLRNKERARMWHKMLKMQLHPLRRQGLPRIRTMQRIHRQRTRDLIQWRLAAMKMQNQNQFPHLHHL